MLETPGSPPAPASRPRYAGFWLRFLAELTDSTLLTVASMVVQATIVGAIYAFRSAQLRSAGAETPGFFEFFSPFTLQMMNLAIYGVLAVPYYVWGHFTYGTTLGKRPFRIYVVSAATLQPLSLKQSWIRCLGYLISYLPFGCGYLMAAFHPQKLALHDLIAGTVSVIKRD